MSLTAAQYWALSRAHDAKQQFFDLQFGWIRLLQYATHRGENDPKPRIEDFVLFEDSVRRGRTEQTPDEQLAFVQNILVPQLQALHDIEEKYKDKRRVAGES